MKGMVMIFIFLILTLFEVCKIILRAFTPSLYRLTVQFRHREKYNLSK